MSDKKCEAITGDKVMPGWGCCQCNTYNGEHRPACKYCGHERCYFPKVVIEATVNKSNLN